MQELNEQRDARQPWEQLRPEIDEMLGALRECDREAVLLRFFEELSFAAVGQRLKISEDAARVRVSRALDELSRRLSRRGIASTGAAVGTCLGGEAAIASPAGWPAAIASQAIAAMPSITWLECILSLMKTPSGIAGAIVLLCVSVMWVRDENQIPSREEQQLMRAQSAARVTLKESPLSHPAPGPTPSIAKLSDTSSTPVLAKPEPRPFPFSPSPRVWIDAGRTTPEAALETLLFAGAKGDVDMIVSGIELGPQMRAKLQSQLPPAERGQPFAAERLLARMLTTSTASVRGMQITGRATVDNRTILLRARMESTDGLAKDREYKFRQSSDSWSLLVDQ